MKDYSASEIRNVALVGHGGAGKTTLAEAILYTIGITTRMGSTQDKNTASDYTTEEHDAQYSLHSTVIQVENGDAKLNIIDTPGYTDFIGEAVGALRAVDNALFVLNAQTGIEVGTELMWSYAADYGMPRMAVINACSREHADFDGTVEQAKERWGNGATVLQIPGNQGEGFNQILDVIDQKLYTYEAGGKGKGTTSDVPADMVDTVAELHEQLVEAVAESDETLMEAYFEAGELDADTLDKGLRAAVASGTLIPILCADAQHNVGTDHLLRYINSLLSSPADAGDIEGAVVDSDATMSIAPTVDEPVCAFVFKTLSEEHVGDLSFVRVYSGTLPHNVELENTTQSTSERCGASFFIVGHEREDAGHINAGDIGALVKLRATHTGDTLCDEARQVVLKPVDWPAPNIESAIVPRSKGDEDKIATGLHRMHEEDPTFIHSVDAELGQTFIAGQGELHLGVTVKRMTARFKVEVDIIKPKIPYRETIRKSSEARYRHKKQSGGRGQFGDVSVKVEPAQRGEGFEFINAIVGGVIPSKFIPAVQKGVVEAMGSGTVGGFSVVDLKATVFDGQYHDVDSSEIAFRLAALNAFKAAMADAGPVLLEPIHQLEVTVPEEFMGDVMGDLSGRRGKIQGMDANGPFQVIRANVPLGSLYRYSTDLRSMTGGRGFYKREFSHYEDVPTDVAKQIVEELQKEQEEDES